MSKDDATGRLIGVFKNLISEGTLTPGGRLQAERELADTFGVSWSSLRQALKVLEIMSVLSQRVGDGTYLNAGAPSTPAWSRAGKTHPDLWKRICFFTRRCF